MSQKISGEITLTIRQREVAQRLSDGMKISAIAEDLGITESRVNQIVRTLKDRFEVETHGGIASAYRDALPNITDATLAAKGSAAEETATESLVPAAFNGANAAIFRLGAVVTLAVLIIVALILLMSFATSISSAGDGNVSIRGQSEQRPEGQ